jgi:hypothetical protein
MITDVLAILPFVTNQRSGWIQGDHWKYDSQFDDVMIPIHERQERYKITFLLLQQ